MRIQQICKIKGCNKEEYSRGFCPEHSQSLYYKIETFDKYNKKCFIYECNKPVNSMYKKYNKGLCEQHNNPKNKMKIARSDDKFSLNEKEYKRRKAKRKEKHKYKNYIIAQNLRSRMNSAIRKHKKNKQNSAIKDLGCTIDEFIKYIESKFQPGMTWENYGFKGWHLDHIIPLCKFDLTMIEEYKRAAHYTNIQPLWWNDNFSKNGR